MPDPTVEAGPQDMQLCLGPAEVKDAYWAVFDTEDHKTPPGPRIVEIMDHRIGDLAGRCQGIYPAAA